MSNLNGGSGAVTVHGWELRNNVWNPGTLVEGRDYTIASTYNPENLAAGTMMTWNFPTPIETVRAYPELIYGLSPHGTSVNPINHNVFPVQLKDIERLTSRYDVEYGGFTPGFDVAFDIWLTNSPDTVSKQTITNEVMIWLHSPAPGAWGNRIGTYSDDDFTGTIFYNQAISHTVPYTAVVSSVDLKTGTVDLAAIFRKLESLGVISANEYLAGIEFGAEILAGAGYMKINDLSIDVQTKGLNGPVTAHAITGMGAALVAPQAPIVAPTPVSNIIDGTVGGTLDGSNGKTVSYANATNGVTVALAATGPQNTGAGIAHLINVASVVGSQFNDMLRGKPGVNVTLEGGAGNDTLVGGNATNILDGGDGIDTVVLGGVSTSYTFARGSDGNITVSGNSQTNLLKNVERVSFSNKTISLGALPSAASDMNGDGVSDIFWQDNQSNLSIWTMSSALQTKSVSQGAMGANWRAVSMVDLDGNGTSDILLQRANGQVGVWLRKEGGIVTYTGGVLNASGATVASPGATLASWASWRVLGSGDFNGDGKGDILWQNSSGQVVTWTMNGKTLAASRVLGNAPGSGWNVVGTGDFNGDHTDDILWQNTNSGQLQIWMMDGSVVTRAPVVASNPGPAWNVRSVADFNGDGEDDILMQNDNGQVGVWLMHGWTATYAGAVLDANGAAAPNPGASWKAVSASDFNGDGRSDILLQNSDGTARIWAMNGNKLLSTAAIGNPGAAWHVATGVG